ATLPLITVAVAGLDVGLDLEAPGRGPHLSLAVVCGLLAGLAVGFHLHDAISSGWEVDSGVLSMQPRLSLSPESSIRGWRGYHQRPAKPFTRTREKVPWWECLMSSYSVGPVQTLETRTLRCTILAVPDSAEPRERCSSWSPMTRFPTG